MAVRISSAAAIAACDAIVDLVDGGAAGGELIIYSGTRPATVDTTITDQTELVTFTLADPSFGNATDVTAGGVATLEDVAAVQASATGTATFFRMFDSDGNAILDGEVTDTEGSGDLKLSSTSVIQDIEVTIVSMTATMPKGAA